MTGPAYAQGGIVRAGTMTLPEGVSFTYRPGRLEAELGEAMLRPLAPADLAAPSRALSFTLDLTGIDPALLALLFGLPDPDADRAQLDAWETDGGAIR